MTFLSICLVLLSCVLTISKHVLWTKEHSICTSFIDLNKHLSGYGNHTIQCHYAPYYVHITEELKTNAKLQSYNRKIYQTILDLYSDLEINRKKPPSVLIEQMNKSVTIHPISFAIPDSNIIMTTPPKRKSFGQVIPGNYSTYFSLMNSSLYYEDIESSLFYITYKKGGWDCLRHYEILAYGSLPLFVNINECPSQTLTSHPKQLYSLLLQFPGLSFQATKVDSMTMKFNKLEFDYSNFDKQLYSVILSAMLQYTRNILSTTGTASYVLETMKKYSQYYMKSFTPKSILYLTHQDHDMDKGDYMTDFLLIGLKQLLGDTAVVDFPSRDCIYKTSNEFFQPDYIKRKAKLYGAGFSWGLLVDQLTNKERDHNVVKDNIIHHRYDIIILGSGHRDGWASRLHYWNLICQYYHPLEVGWVDGSDKHLPKKLIMKYSPCAGHMFSREGYNGS
eukprot:gene4504-6364_t